MDYMNWMSQTSAIHSTFLSNICLPATHDSGTYSLTDILTQGLDSDERTIVRSLSEVACQVINNQSIPDSDIFEYVSNPSQWIYNTVIPYINGLMTATGQNIATQLKDGIRCLDLRVYYDAPSNQFYTYHTLIGSPLTAVLVALSNFLQTTQAEIVYVTLGHLRGFGEGDTFNQNVSLLCETVKAYVGNFVYVPEYSGGSITDNPFGQTYNQIVTQNSSTPQSRAILVLGVDSPPDPAFWPVQYSPPDNGGIVFGSYANTDDLPTMVEDQMNKFNQRMNLPFALFAILTPQPDQVTSIIGSQLYTTISGEANIIQPSDPNLAGYLMAIANNLKPSEPPLYSSLRELSQKVEPDLKTIIYEKLLRGGQVNNPLSFIYLDFYETVGTDSYPATCLADIAINLSQNIFTPPICLKG
jgi:hypothetical protein